MSRLLPILLMLLWVAGAAQEVVPAPEYESLFNRRSGWTGADGTYSYILSDGSILWSFSDTFIGNVLDGGHVDFEFVNNSHIVQVADGLAFLKAPAFVPPDREGWYWMWDGTYDGEFQVLLGQFGKDAAGIFGFEQIGLWYASSRLHADRLVVSEYVKLPFFERRDGQLITFGSAVLREGAWDYVLGIRDDGPKRSCTLARVPRGRLGLSGVWRFWDGTDWVKDPWEAESLFVGASMESSVHPTEDGGYLYVGSLDTGGQVVARYARSLTGPWSEATDVYRAPQVQGDVIAYNAKAHPELSVDDRILVSYNVNTTSLERVVAEADIYRPRFIWWLPEDKGWLPRKDAYVR